MFLLHIATLTQAEQVNHNDCSKELSRQARLIINKVVLPRYTLKRLEIPEKCPLSTANDQHAAHEAMKRRLGKKWMCSVCGKNFDDENGLDVHLDESHPAPPTSGCLADYCDILRCEPYFNLLKTHNQCLDDEMAELKLKCMNLIRDECSPQFLPPTERLQVEVSVQASICSFLSCDMYWVLPEEDVPDAGSFYYITYAVALVALVAFLAIYFKIATSNLENSKSLEQILAEADQYERPQPQIIPPDNPDMEIRHRNPTVNRQWNEYE